jgi:Holliday junction resolvase-like predicted endonuclease
MSIGYQEFRSLVDEALSANTPATLKTHEEVQNAISGCFTSGSPRLRARNLVQWLTQRHAADGASLQPYSGIAQFIANVSMQEGPIVPPIGEWASAVSIAVAHRGLFYMPDEETTKILQARAMAFGEAVKELRGLGYALELSNEGQLSMEDGPLQKLNADLDNLAALIGGAELVNRVLKHLTDALAYDDEFERFIITRYGSALGTVPAEPQVPWGYLFQLGIKHLHAGGRPSTRDFEKLIKLSRLAVAVIDIQPYGGVGSFFLTAATVTGFLQESARYDSLFGLQQLPSADCELQLATLGNGGKLAGTAKGGAALTDLPAIARVILAKADTRKATSVTAAEIGKALHKSQRNIKSILDQVFAHTSPPNQDLEFPPLTTDMGYHGRPLVAMSDGSYWCPPRSVAAKAMFDAVMRAVREVNVDVDSQLGKLLEGMLIKQATARGLTIKSGEYFVQSVKKADGDCDLVIETDREIVFMEVKKKTLTYAAQSGADLQLLLDMAQGFASSQQQAMKHERFVRQAPLTLKAPGREDQQLAHNGRRVLRVSVVSFDYGSLHDRATLQQFLNIGCRSRIDAKDPVMQVHADKVNDAFTKLRELAKANGEFNRKTPFFDSVLLSIPQLLYLLRKSTDNASFVSELIDYERMNFNMKDWYAHRQYTGWLKRQQLQG